MITSPGYTCVTSNTDPNAVLDLNSDHDFDAILEALGKLPPAGAGKPQLIVADTIKGRGVRRMELSLQWHVANLAGEDYDDAVAEIRAGLQPREAPESKSGKAAR